MGHVINRVRRLKVSLCQKELGCEVLGKYGKWMKKPKSKERLANKGLDKEIV
jgi:hypothetical protein